MCYTTIYASRLAKPGYDKVINTVEDFIEKGINDDPLNRNLYSIPQATNSFFVDMYWGTFHVYEDIVASLNASSIAAYGELNRRTFVFENSMDAETGLASGKFGVYAGITNGKYFVTYDWNEQLNLLASFRLMKKVCIFNYYTVFALQRFSPYTELFSQYALQLVSEPISVIYF